MKKGWAICTPTRELFDEVISYNVKTKSIESADWTTYEDNTVVVYGLEDTKFYYCSFDYATKESEESYNWLSIEQFREMVGSVVQTSAETNPKKQFGLASLPLHLWSDLASAYGALGLYNGACKYGRNNFKATPVEASIYIAAAKRHLAAWSEGEEFDPADGVPNLGGVLANIAILLEARAAGTLVDDRQMGTGYLKERETLKQIMADVTKVHEGKSPRHYTIKDNK